MTADSPQSFDHCTQPLGALRQNLFSCLTCNPPPASPLEPYNPAGVCYSCSIACHGEHTLVELFNKRNFTCDCGTTRLPSSSPCTLRINPATGVKGPVHSQPPAEGNTYNQNFRNRFCGCGEFYDASRERGTMYQCIGMSREEDGGCGEDWWHPECLLGLPRDWYKAAEDGANVERSVGNESTDAATHGDGNEEHPTPPDFPDEEDFEALICYKCTEANPWIKRYAGTRGFLPSLKYGGRSREEKDAKREETTTNAMSSPSGSSQTPADPSLSSKKRKAEDSDSDDSFVSAKKVKAESENFDSETLGESVACYYSSLPPAIDGPISLLSRDEDFRLYFCRCPSCYPSLSKCPQLLEEEESYEPPHSEDGGESMGTGSLLDRGEAALSNVDRVRAIGKSSMSNPIIDRVFRLLVASRLY